VVVDAVNDSEPARETWRRAARASGARLVVGVLALADADLHRRRLEGRSRPFVRIAEPRWEAVRARMATTEPWDASVLHLDAGRPVAELARAVRSALPSSRSSATAT
jgi:predicted kinase